MKTRAPFTAQSVLPTVSAVFVCLAIAACGGGNQTGDTGGGDSTTDSISNGDGNGNDLVSNDADGGHLDASDGTVTNGDGADGAMDAADADGGALSDAATSDHVVVCPGCPCFPGTDCTGTGADGGLSGSDGGTPPMCTTAGEAPTLVYPPDGVLLPPNTNVIEVQFTPGAGNTLFEIDFQNAVTDVRFVTTCNPITNSRGIATGGCSFTVDMGNWRYVADVNRGGDPVHVIVRATPDGSCIGASNSRDILFSTDDLQGGIYYWQSATVDGVPGRAGGIFRYDFGREDIAPEPFLLSSAATGSRCIGCHFVSRDGLRISYGNDDPDSDDEYGDLSSRLMDITTRSLLSTNIVPGFRTFTHDHAYMLASDGRGTQNPPSFFRYNGNSGAVVDHAISGGVRGTQPDWAPDDSQIVFVRPAMFLRPGPTTSLTQGDDNHFYGGSLYTMSYDGTTFGTPAALLMAASTGENNYYPSYSPDGSFIVFNRVSGTAGVATDAFSNPNARIFAMPAGGGTPVDLSNLNMGDGLSNSWPRWSPYVQMDRGHRILWLTFSSIRDYGLRVQNQEPNGVSCYPPESPENNNTSHSCPLVPTSCGCTDAGTCAQFCVQPQIWMAAVRVDTVGGISAGVDVSYPAFWLPFQDDTAHNHIAQWVSMIPGEPPPPDAGVPDASGTDAAATDATPGMDAVTDTTPPPCGTGGAACGAAGDPLCCAAYACVSGSCGVP